MYAGTPGNTQYAMLNENHSDSIGVAKQDACLDVKVCKVMVGCYNVVIQTPAIASLFQSQGRFLSVFKCLHVRLVGLHVEFVFRNYMFLAIFVSYL